MTSITIQVDTACHVAGHVLHLIVGVSCQLAARCIQSRCNNLGQYTPAL